MTLVYDAPRGLAPKAELYAALRRLDDALERIAYLESELAALVASDDDVNIARLKAEMPIRPGALRLLIRLRRAHPRLVRRPDCPLADNVEKAHMCALRSAIRHAGGPANAFRTVHGVGYAFNDEGIEWVRGAFPWLAP